jgi:hypothetical protein
MKSLINEHDITKMMIEKINESKLIREQEEVQDTDNKKSITITGSELKNEENRFTEYMGTNRVEFNELNLYPAENNAVWSGKFNNGIEWQISVNDDMVINTQGTPIDDPEMELIEKLKKYASVWGEEWAKKLRTDYANEG